jgi:uncharacterized protein (TIGR02271 family)
MPISQHARIVGLFADRAQAEQAQKELLGAGYSQEQIKTSVEDLTASKVISSSIIPANEMVRNGAIGGGAGALLGTGAGFLAHKMNSSLATRPLWLLMLAGAAIGSMLGSVPGLLIGKSMSSSRVPQNERPSRVLITIETDNPQAILDTMRRNGAYEVQNTPVPAIQQPQVQPPLASTAQQTPHPSVPETTQAPSLIVGTFPDQGTADTAIDALLQAGFTSEQIRYSVHGAAGGGIQQYLINMGVPHDVAQMYEQEFEVQWNTIVTVQTDNRQQEARHLMETHGGINIRQFSTQTAATSTPALEAMHDIKLREERLRVRKQQVQTGEVNVHRETVTEEKTITIPVTREEMVVEYHTGGEGEKSETVRIPLSEEQVDVTKHIVPMNEVNVHREQVQDVQHITETVKREELQVEHQGDVKIIETTEGNSTEQGTTGQS